MKLETVSIGATAIGLTLVGLYQLAMQWMPPVLNKLAWGLVFIGGITALYQFLKKVF
jgi:hypothetical protein